MALYHSFSPMPFFVFLGGVTSSPMVYSVSAAVIQFSFLANSSWTLNLSIEVYRRLAHFIHTCKYRRIPYMLSGWLLPVIVVIICLCIKFDIYNNRNDFWFPVNSSVMIPSVMIAVTMNMTSIILLALTKRNFDRDRRFYEYEEWHKFWEDLRTIMLTLPVTILTWLCGSFAIVSEN
ncbi:cadherin EGF LAG seven-pass G-type receptor 1-like [Ptychodera flava]|uniref:cadherin EGF LAG seven-pass G-type receptor 1-like n=1 Tax=Ptychodera flava TaxID=63121 RepID=UPI003969D9C4